MTTKTNRRPRFGMPAAVAASALASLCAAPAAFASEADLILPDLSSVKFMGVNGRTLLMVGLLVCAAGMAFGLFFYRKLKNLPVHKSMLDVSELIYETCKTYLKTQGKFIMILWVFIASIMVVYFGFLTTPHAPAAGSAAAAHANADAISTPVKV